LSHLLGAFDVLSARPFVGVLGFERDCVAFVQLIKSDSNQRRVMEEDVFIRAIGRDEAEPLLPRQSLDFSSHIYV